MTNGSASNGLPSRTGMEKVKASTLVHDGKLLYEMGKLDEAEAKLKAAIKQDPNNEAASYYLNLVAEARFTQGNRGSDASRCPLPTPIPARILSIPAMAARQSSQA